MPSGIQQKVFAYIFDQYSSKSSAVTDLKNALSISQSAVYKRIKGDSLLTLIELELLIAKYQIPSDVIVQKSPEKIVFDFPPLAEKLFSRDRFLSLVMKELNRLSGSSNSHVAYTTIDIPFFYYFMHKELAWFKLFRFKHGISQKNITQIPKISFDAISPSDQQIFKKIVKLYSQVDSTEIWTSQAIKVTAKEILYFYKAGLFESVEGALMLLDKLSLLADQLFEVVSQNNKGLMNEEPTLGKHLNLSYNDFSQFSSVIVSQSDNHAVLFLTYNVPNFMYNDDEQFVGYTMKWIKKLNRKAQSLTNALELQQMAFFTEITKYIETTKEKIVLLNRAPLVVSI